MGGKADQDAAAEAAPRRPSRGGAHPPFSAAPDFCRRAPPPGTRRVPRPSLGCRQRLEPSAAAAAAAAATIAKAGPLPTYVRHGLAGDAVKMARRADAVSHSRHRRLNSPLNAMSVEANLRSASYPWACRASIRATMEGSWTLSSVASLGRDQLVDVVVALDWCTRPAKPVRYRR